MALFDIPTRTNSRVNDKKLAQKAKIVNKATPTIKGGSSLLDRVNSIKDLVEKNLGKYKDVSLLIQTKQELQNYINVCIHNNVISIDTETAGLDPLQHDIAGICIYTPGMPGAYIPINHVSYITNLPVPNQLNKDTIVEVFNKMLNHYIDIIMFNAQFDIRFLRHQVGLHNIYCTWDCSIAQKLLNENEQDKSLKMLHRKYVLNGEEDAFKFDELFKGIPFTMIPLQTAYLYACHDPVITYELYEYQHQFLCEDSDREDMRALYWDFINIEMPCVIPVCNMEDNGVLIDLDYQQSLSEKYNKILNEKISVFHKEVNKFQDKIEAYKRKHKDCKLADPINIASPPQLAILLYDVLEYKSVDRRSPRGTGEEILVKFDTPLVKSILDYRATAKLVDTYIDKLPNCINPNDGRIHCEFNQYGTVTGRFSSKNPNLQNIPSKNKDIRPMFIASPGYVFMSSDFSQQEPKCLASLCKKQGDPQMYNTFMDGKDLYSEIASKAFNKPYEECKEFNEDGTTNKEGKARRTQAKSILLGVLYGREVNSIAEQLNCSVEKAKQIKESVFKGFPAIKQFEKDSLQMAKDIGYVTTVAGRKRRLPELQLDEYEFSWKDGVSPDTDLLDFDEEEVEQEIPERTIRKYLTRLHNCRFSEKSKIINQAKEEGIRIVDNGAKIAEATRQCVNSRIQGSAADLTKLAMIGLDNNKRLKELGFRLLIQVHDEIIAECPKENAKECAKLLAEVMSASAEKILEMPIKCDVEITEAWYGKAVDIGN